MLRASFVNKFLVSKAGGISVDIFVVPSREATVEARSVSALRNSCLRVPRSAVLMMFYFNMTRIGAVSSSTAIDKEDKDEKTPMSKQVQKGGLIKTSP